MVRSRPFSNRCATEWPSGWQWWSGHGPRRAAAAAGGFTAVAAMPNTAPVNDSPETTRWMLAPERGAAVRVFPIAAATRGSKGEAINDFAALKSAGAVAVTDDGQPILKD